MQWIFLSPHFDDAVLSCGGIIWEEARRGAQVSIWTVCAAPPRLGELSQFAKQLHARWGTGPNATAQRSLEDITSCAVLGTTHRHLDLHDCIYRMGANGEFLYTSEEALSGGLHPLDQIWIERLSEELKRDIPPRTRVVCPLTIGNHVDHQLTRAAAERLGKRLWYYADYPYVQLKPQQLAQMLDNSYHSKHYQVSKPGLTAWQDSIAAHSSQISTFWLDMPSMREAIQSYAALDYATNLWHKGRKPKTSS